MYENRQERRDYGGEPLIVNIDRLTKVNPNFRTALWTGEHLQVTLMSIPQEARSVLKCIPIWISFYGLKAGALS